MFNRYMEDTEWRLKVGGVALVIFLAIIGIWYVVTYRYITSGTIIATNWELKIARLQYMTVDENDWSVPNGGRVYDQRREFHHTERYVSGHHTETYSDRQSYSCGTSKKPKTCYRSVTKTRTVTDYSTRSIYKTKYYYYIDRWMNIEPLRTAGTDKEDVHWPNTEDGNYNESNVIGNIKLGGKWSHYWIVLNCEGKTYEQDMLDAEWFTYAKGQNVKLTFGYFNNILKIEKKGAY